MDSIAILKTTGFSGDDVNGSLFHLEIIGFTGGFWTVVWVSFSVIIDNIPLKPLLAHGKNIPR
jgi:hypothetical protein